MIYQLDRPLPKNASQFLLEIDRATTKDSTLYSGEVYITTYFSPDGIKGWILGPGIGAGGGIIKRPEIRNPGGKIESPERDEPITSLSFDISAQGFAGMHMQIRVQAKAITSLKPPRLMIGIA